ncbi:hypothetical protein [Paenibacillus sp. O199]|uniref:hypothetical protein n=1 Tax=Paenibacillus sp. O199 TaxID=1643925 RepID=UPI0007BFB5F3|nr:hypothetical protein [Paenibacillus sp. O199]
MKIKSVIIDKYSELCPLSFMKCESFSEVEYKIERSIALGQTIKRTEKERHVQYYHNCFVIQNNTVVDMYKDLSKCVDVRKSVKNAYDWKAGKAIV